MARTFPSLDIPDECDECEEVWDNCECGLDPED